ncbi:uncharacterized protein LOC105215033 isoform X3 [Zeugodacus cucurbitae]|uniref:uncharacterized protein LOC105215033 isoform X3 n=1 Tax=Zeugodacus cucurbitae TaxID=28588 RepID=UPI0023D9603B|nr:uncharacterized protein LOC105215033 isoform X3 [Zeugodacus cucurbitae]
MAELMDAKLKKDKIRRREKPNKKWTAEEVGQVLNYLLEHPSFEVICSYSDFVCLYLLVSQQIGI